MLYSEYSRALTFESACEAGRLPVSSCHRVVEFFAHFDRFPHALGASEAWYSLSLVFAWSFVSGLYLVCLWVVSGLCLGLSLA
jgi:hypothetical protein